MVVRNRYVEDCFQLWRAGRWSRGSVSEASSPPTMLWVTGVLLLLLAAASALPLLQGVSSCPIGAPDLEQCIQRNLNAYISKLAHGWSEMVPSLDPLVLPVGEATYEDGNMTLTLKLKNISITGLSQTKVNIVRANSLDEGKFELMCKTPSISATGSYSSDGFVASLPLFSYGPFNLTLVDLTSHFVVHLESMDRHLQVKYIGLNVMPSLIDVQASKQLDDDNKLGVTLNVYLNENSFELYNLIRPRLMDFFSDLLKTVANTLLQHTTESEVFPNLYLRK